MLFAPALSIRRRRHKRSIRPSRRSWLLFQSDAWARPTSAPAGGYGTDEIKVTDSGLLALCLAYARFIAGESDLGLVMSWCKSSKTDVEAVMRLRGDPFFMRPLGINAAIGDALFAQAVG